MAGALVVLYTFYIHEIQQAQMARLLDAQKPVATQRDKAASLPSVLPGLTSSLRSVETSLKHPLIVHNAPVPREIIAEWKDKPPVAAALKDQ
jgi:hypothetical protein